MTLAKDDVVQYLARRLGDTAELEILISEIPGFEGWPAREGRTSGQERLLERIVDEGKIDMKNDSQITIHRSINY